MRLDFDERLKTHGSTVPLRGWTTLRRYDDTTWVSSSEPMMNSSCRRVVVQPA
jgi:hypothetical protein